VHFRRMIALRKKRHAAHRRCMRNRTCRARWYAARRARHRRHRAACARRAAKKRRRAVPVV
jgi:hypothetical protein